MFMTAKQRAEADEADERDAKDRRIADLEARLTEYRALSGAVTMQCGAKAWAVWNSCQGVFTCSVTHTRKEAEEILERTRTGDDEKVVPVRVVVEPESEWWHRSAEEADAEKFR